VILVTFIFEPHFIARAGVDIGAWLRDLGLERYADSFEANAIDFEVLSELTEADLEKLGVLLGHRKKVLKAIAALAGQAAPSLAADAGIPPRVEAERRQLTVMFVDLVGSTELAARLDPEDMSRVIRAYQECCTQAVERWDGHVAKYMGDGVLGYFGWPQAHEDEAERAVRAGLAITTAIRQLTNPGGEPLAARIGIATGLVMVGELIGEGAAQEQAVVGETPNLAARLQTLAAPGSVVISQATRRLVGGLFELDDLGPQRLKGFAEPLSAWRVEGEGRAEGRFEALHGERLTPLVGREHELGILLERWAWAEDGDGQVVLLTGEPGIGKSRVIRALRERLGVGPYTPLSHYCSPYHTNSALYPVIGLLERAARLDRNEAPEAQLAKLEVLLARSSDRLGEVVPLLAALLGVPTGARYPALTLTPELQKRRTFEALLEQLAGLAAQQPVLALYEDVHWIDPSTLELLGLVIERIRDLPVLALITFRPEFQPPGTGHAHVTTLTMNRLGRRQGGNLVARVTGDKPLPAQIVEQIVARTDGVPLFVEELTKTVLESGLLADAGDRWELSGPLPPLAIPTTLHDSLIARLDRLAPVKEVAQTAAVIGREFSHELLAAVSPLSEPDLNSALDQLLAAELIFRRGAPPDATYAFKHALVQDAAYQSLLKSKRQQLHARIAEMLEQRFPEVGETRPEVLAHHFTEAIIAERAIHYWQRAGERAIERSANLEAIVQLRQALQLIGGLPETRERDEVELRLLVGLGQSLAAIAGGPAPETRKAFNRARDLSRKLDDRVHVHSILSGLWIGYLIGGQTRHAIEVANEYLQLAHSEKHGAPNWVGHRMMGSALTMLGEPAAARTHFQQVLTSHDPVQHARLAYLHVHDPRVSSLGYLAHVNWILGYPERAFEYLNQCLSEAKDSLHFNSKAFAHMWAAILFAFCGSNRDAEREAQRLIEVSKKHGSKFWSAPATIILGSAQVRSGDLDAGLRNIGDGFAMWHAVGGRQFQPFFLCLEAEAYLRAAQTDAASASLAHARKSLKETEQYLFEPELQRLTGDSTLARGEAAREAEIAYTAAIESARRMSARSWELRAATSLARLWRDGGRRAEARDLLAPVYGWFTEGFDTPDLKDAKALLDELS
jgi:class 3 adenylate cyclase/predicted ATPase